MKAHTLMIADRDFANREHDLLSRVDEGLIREGVTRSRAIPVGVNEWKTPGIFATVGYEDSRGILTGEEPHIQIIDDLQRIEGATPLSVVHAWGPGSFGAALDLAHEAGASVVFDVSSEQAARRVRSMRRAIASFVEETGARACALCADAFLADALSGRGFDRIGVRTLPWGVPGATELAEDEIEKSGGPRRAGGPRGEIGRAHV